MNYGAPPRYTPSSKRSAWKRPKPKVYECNERDAMRFYETSYNEYRRNKEDAEDRRRAEMNRDILQDHPLSWRSHSLARERPRPSREEERPTRDPFKREGSLSGLNSTDSHDGRTRLNNQSATEVDDDFQARLDRLKKLREELGLPNQNGTAETSSSSLSQSSARETNESGYKSSFSSESKYGSTKKSASAAEEEDDVPKSRFLRSKATPVKEETPPRENKWSKYSSYKEKREGDPEPDVVDPEEYTYKAKSRSSGWRSKLADDLSKCELYENIDKDRKSPNPLSFKKNDYSFKSSGASDVNGDSSFSTRSAYKSDYSSDAGGGSSKYSAASASSSSYKSRAVDMSDDFDTDDSVIAALGKKLPSSAEILERISKMNLDD